MPCDTISLASIHLGLCNQDILRQTLESWADKGSVKTDGLGFWRFSHQGIDYRINSDGDLVSRQDDEVNAAKANELKRAYAKKMVHTGAQKFGWTVSSRGKEKLTLKR
jgi:hypothetical protein